MIREIDKIELVDGALLEIKFRNKWFESPEISRAFRSLVLATKVGKTHVLRFFFIHPSYFRAFEELGLPFLFVPKVSNYGKYQTQIAEVIQLSKEKANLEYSQFTNKIAPIILEAFIKPFFQWLKETKIPTKKAEEEEIRKQFIFEAIEKMAESTADKDVIKKFVRKHISPEIFSDVLSLVRTTFNLFSNKFVENGLDRYRLLVREISDNNIEKCERTINALLEQNIVTPLVTVAVCMNKYCKHVEVTMSDRIPKARCGKCEGEVLSTTFAFINEPYLWLKEKMLDLHAFLQSYIESKSTPEYVDDNLMPSLKCFLNPYIRNMPNPDQREVDALIYSTITKKAVAVEIKIHQIRSQLPHDRLQNILNNDLRQLVETLQQTDLRNGCYITNLKISDDEIQNIKENMIPKLFSKRDEREIEIISAVDETTFLSKLDNLIEKMHTREPQS